MLSFGDTPSGADPGHSWPKYSIVGGVGGSKTGRSNILLDMSVGLQQRREDDEIIIILSAILKEL